MSKFQQNDNPRTRRLVRGIALVRVADRFFDIKAWVDLLSGVEDIVWVKDGFGLCEEVEDRLLKELREVWRSDDAVVVLAADVAFELDGGVVEALGHAFDEEWGVCLREVEEWIEVEVTVAAVTMDS